MSIQQKLTHAYLWNLVGRWGLRFIGIGSTLVLVRLLPPEAFGIVATATIYIGFFETLSAIGVKRYLIAHTDLSNRDLNTAWTLRILIKLVLTVVLIASSSLIASFVGEPDLELIIIVISISGFLGAFGNIGLVKLEKDVNFKPMVQLGIVVKIITAVTTLGIAYIHPTYWALVIGSSVGALLNMFGSYIVYKYTPRFDWRFKMAMIANSTWLLLRGVLGYSKNRFDLFLVSSTFSSQQVGQYKIAQDFSILPFTELIGPATWGLFPALSHLKNDKKQLYLNTYKFLALTYLLIIPSIVGMFIVSEQFIYVVLGQQWTAVIPILGPLSIMMLGYPLQSLSHNIYDYLGKTKVSILLDVIALLLLAGVFYAAYSLAYLGDLTQFVYLRVAVAFFMFFVTAMFIKITLGFSLRALSIVILVPSVAALIMYASLEFGYMSYSNTLLGLLINVLLGSLYYGVSVTTIIYLVGKKSLIWGYWMSKISEAKSKLAPIIIDRIHLHLRKLR
ncbi:oligosaccharide flippase family protein [Vibrio alfacsensis]|uniref:oligosaccharide flippase family protein n=1 Tax=Vibrio alfacsensis TaxID=1074311 RepID=UPI001BEE48AD|nr:oligosaccharide flippase family protein [Vibrio alfacsensis]BCN27286.1 lipopolysaccharide biosynthesis protein [Vibrio alfacsensis]